jgi:hypothetical protein
MATLRIEHFVDDFDAWKQAFDSDPIGRGGAGCAATASCVTSAIRAT